MFDNYKDAHYFAQEMRCGDELEIYQCHTLNQIEHYQYFNTNYRVLQEACRTGQYFDLSYKDSLSPPRQNTFYCDAVKLFGSPVRR